MEVEGRFDQEREEKILYYDCLTPVSFFARRVIEEASPKGPPLPDEVPEEA